MSPFFYSTVTLLARFLGLSISHFLSNATSYDNIWHATIITKFWIYSLVRGTTISKSIIFLSMLIDSLRIVIILAPLLLASIILLTVF